MELAIIVLNKRQEILWWCHGPRQLVTTLETTNPSLLDEWRRGIR